ncbi:hypothetical protein J7481_12455 [Labrenzia sp. R4_2]|uniref:hypothetical protein n=1 Tax=Labrenzia sp. R4_2 TaxID=2821107 RepID=UPI001AD96C34|nr:hypothetical protein [Labrenzia sp. R4_2]MBO9420308.1 hypothetical protein [Labrenzia sp. R4_2]
MQLFDNDFYIASYPDVADAIASGLLQSAEDHFFGFGFTEGRDPNPYFDTSYYIEQNPDVAAAGLNPLAHYVQFGESEGRKPSALFDPGYYAQQNPDVSASGVRLLEHYISFGKSEGRLPYAQTEGQTPSAGSNLLVVAYTDRNGNDQWDGETVDTLIAALIDQDNSGTPSVGDIFKQGTVPSNVFDPSGTEHMPLDGTVFSANSETVTYVNERVPQSTQIDIGLQNGAYISFFSDGLMERFYQNLDAFNQDKMEGFTDRILDVSDVQTNLWGGDSFQYWPEPVPFSSSDGYDWTQRPGDQAFLNIDFF